MTVGYDERCGCIGCTVLKIRVALNEHIPNIDMCIKAIFLFNNYDRNSVDDEDLDKCKKCIMVIEENLYSDLDEVIRQLDIIDLFCDENEKKYYEFSSKRQTLKGIPNVSIKDRVKAYDNKLDNMSNKQKKEL